MKVRNLSGTASEIDSTRLKASGFEAVLFYLKARFKTNVKSCKITERRNKKCYPLIRFLTHSPC